MVKKTYISGGRTDKSVNVKTAKGRKESSTHWLRRQLNDPYVQQAQKDGYRSRAAYKLLEINDQFGIFKSRDVVVDLGAAPGSWTQIAVNLVGKNRVIGLDLQEIDPIDGAEFIVGDFLEDETLHKLQDILNLRGCNKIDVVISDMAAAACGHEQTDYIRIMSLCELALDFAINWLKPDGNFVAKVLRGGAEKEILQNLKKNFKKVKHYKPAASRDGSAEIYVVATGFNGIEGSAKVFQHLKNNENYS